MARMVSAVVLVAVSGLLDPVFAGVTFIDPIPYLSAADSPFDMSGLGSTFFLEDFEDGDWDLPEGAAARGFLVRMPGPITDSVDADDGLINGSGSSGHSMVPSFHSHNFANPQGRASAFAMSFYGQQLGFVPNAFGVVVTDGIVGGRLIMSVLDNSRAVIAAKEYSMDQDPSHAGSVQLDRFIGFSSDIPFETVAVAYHYVGNSQAGTFEVDHVQFGLTSIPEPGSMAFSMALIGGWLLIGNTRRLLKIRAHEKESRNDNPTTWKDGHRGGGRASLVLSSWNRGCCVLWDLFPVRRCQLLRITTV